MAFDGVTVAIECSAGGNTQSDPTAAAQVAAEFGYALDFVPAGAGRLGPANLCARGRRESKALKNRGDPG